LTTLNREEIVTPNDFDTGRSCSLLQVSLLLVISVFGFSRQAYSQEAAAPKWSRDVQRLLNFEDEERSLLTNLPTSHDELATLYCDFGQYAKAVHHYQKSLEHYKPTGPSLVRHVEISNLLAQTYLEMGLFAEARRLLEKNLDRLAAYHSQKDSIPGESNSHVPPSSLLGDTLELHAEFLRETGDFDLAESVYRRVLGLRKLHFGETDRHFAVSLHNFGIFEWQRGNYEQAEQLLREEWELTQRLAPNSKDFAHSSESLALVLTDAGKFAEAESHFRIAIKLYETTSGNDRDLYRALNNLGYLHIFTGRHEESLDLLKKAVAGRKALLGEDHLDHADSLNDIARLLHFQGREKEAIETSIASLAITRWNVELSSVAQSERQQLEMANLFRNRLDLLLSAAALHPEAATKAFAEILSWKGAVLLRQRGMRVLAGNEQVGEKYEQLQTLTMRIASLSRTVPANSELVDDWKFALERMKLEKERLEAEISRFSSELRTVHASHSVERLVHKMPEGCVLIDFFEYNQCKAAPEQHRFEFVSSLMASVVRRDGSVVAVQYGSSAEIGKDIDLWRESTGTSPASVLAGRRLRERLWEPLLPHLEGSETILVSLDGVLGRMALDALPGREPDTYLIEEHRIAVVPVPQLIPMLVDRSSTHELEKHLLMLGDIDYGGLAQSKPTSESKASLLPWERRSTGPVRAGGPLFAELEQTAGEIAFIERLYKNQAWSNEDGLVVLDRAKATESRFREMAPKCYQLHLATHGFFAASNVKSAFDTKQPNSGHRVLGEQQKMLRGFSPGLLSGLAFTGANHPPQPDRDDGILTADEIVCLPLEGVELVVLSACETGLGEVAGGEGLIGIQRAFQISGARTSVASLWKVPDLSTRLLMERFYENYWDKHRTRVDALRDAKLWILNHPESVRGVSRTDNVDFPKRTQPRYWAAFVLSGDWR